MMLALWCEKERDVERYRMNDLSDADSGVIHGFASVGTAMCFVQRNGRACYVLRMSMCARD
jgi:hypothetical protein